MLTITKKLDMSPHGVPQVIRVSQYDSDFTLEFKLFASGGNFAISTGTTAEIRGTKQSGTGYSASATLDTSTKVVTVAGAAQMTAVAGMNIFEIVLKKNNKEISSANFCLLVERAALDADTITDESVLKELNAIIESADTATQAAEEAEAAADRAEAAAQTLVIDSTPTQGSSNAVSSGGVYDEINGVKNNLNTLIGGEEPREITGWVYGKYINVATPNIGDTVNITNISSFYSLKYVIVDCEEGDKFLLNLSGAASARAWAFLTSSNVLISRADASVTLTDIIITAPQNAGKAIFQCIYRQSDTDTTTDDGEAYKIVQGTGNVVRFDTTQNKTEAEKARARENLGIIRSDGGLSDEAKIALLNCFRHVYWTDHDADYFGILEDALYESPTPTPLYDWDFTNSLTDTISGQTAILKNNWNGALPTINASGVHFNGYGQAIQFFSDTATLEQTLKNRTFQVDVASFTPHSENNSYHTRFIMFSKSKADIDNQVFNVGIVYRNAGQWNMYTADPNSAVGNWGSGFNVTDRNAISGHTVSVYIGNDYKPKLYIDNQLCGTGNLAFYPNMVSLFIGNTDTAQQGATFYDALITGARIYEGDICNGL